MSYRDALLALDRAAYYRWAAVRGQSLPGNDPQTGRPRDAFKYVRPDDESRAAYKAMALHNLRRAHGAVAPLPR